MSVDAPRSNCSPRTLESEFDDFHFVKEADKLVELPTARWPFKAIRELFGMVAIEKTSQHKVAVDLSQRVFELDDVTLDRTMVCYLTPLLKLLHFTPEYESIREAARKTAAPALAVLFDPLNLSLEDVDAVGAMKQVEEKLNPFVKRVEDNWAILAKIRELHKNPGQMEAAKKKQELFEALAIGNQQQRFHAMRVHTLISVALEKIDHSRKVKMFTIALVGTAALIGVIALGILVFSVGGAAATGKGSSLGMMYALSSRNRNNGSGDKKSPSALIAEHMVPIPVEENDSIPEALATIIVDEEILTYEHKSSSTGWWGFLLRRPSQTEGTICLKIGNETFPYKYNLNDYAPIKIEDLFALNSMLHDKLDVGVDPKACLSLLYRLHHCRIDRGEKPPVNGFVNALNMMICFETVLRHGVSLVCEKDPNFSWTNQQEAGFYRQYILPDKLPDL